MKELTLSVLVLSLLGCNISDDDEKSTPYISHDAAVRGFIENNIDTLHQREYHSDHELLSWIVKCGNNYHYLKSWKGGLSNSLTPPKTSCKVVALFHTHPLPKGRGWTSDLFSKADLKSSEKWGVYLLALENCNLRLAKDRKTYLLGKVKCK